MAVQPAKAGRGCALEKQGIEPLLAEPQGQVHVGTESGVGVRLDEAGKPIDDCVQTLRFGLNDAQHHRLDAADAVAQPARDQCKHVDAEYRRRVLVGAVRQVRAVVEHRWQPARHPVKQGTVQHANAFETGKNGALLGLFRAGSAKLGAAHAQARTAASRGSSSVPAQGR